jgi:hypothetical protein
MTVNGLRDICRELIEELERRRTLFANKKVMNMAVYRSNAKPNELLPCLFIAFDNFGTVRNNLSTEVELNLKTLVREGPSYGLHLAITMDRAQDFEHGRLNESFFQVVLRQSYDYIMFSIPKTMIGPWEGRPGRGFIKGEPSQPPMEVQSVLACKTDPRNQVKALEALVLKMREAAAKHPKWSKLLPDLTNTDQPVNAASGGANSSSRASSQKNGQPNGQPSGELSRKYDDRVSNDDSRGKWESIFALPPEPEAASSEENATLATSQISVQPAERPTDASIKAPAKKPDERRRI